MSLREGNRSNCLFISLSLNDGHIQPIVAYFIVSNVGPEWRSKRQRGNSSYSDTNKHSLQVVVAMVT